jgi:hypothetical protein
MPDILVNERDPIIRTSIGAVIENLTRLSSENNGFGGFYERFDKVPNNMFNYFVNVDAIKDNPAAFTKGSNSFFTVPHSSIPNLPSSVSQFKVMMRQIMEDLEHHQMVHLLHIHKLKYKGKGKLPKPDILQHIPPSTSIVVAFDSGTGPTAVFGDKALHEKYIDTRLLCSVANVIDPGPSGSNCDIVVENDYRFKIDKSFFMNFGYSELLRGFSSIAKKKFQFDFEDSIKKKVHTITDDPKYAQYYKGNNANSAFFKSNKSSKLDCDIRTTLKKIGDDLQVFTAGLYKQHANQRNIVMLTCDLGVSFLSLMTGLDCVFKDKDATQSDTPGKKIGNSWYISSLSGAIRTNWAYETEKVKKHVLDEYRDFRSVISDIVSRIQSGSSISIVVKTVMTYKSEQLRANPNIILFFNQILSDLSAIVEQIEQDNTTRETHSDLLALKEMVPNKFLLVNANNSSDSFLFTLATKYTRGKLSNGFAPQTVNTKGEVVAKNGSLPFAHYFKQLMEVPSPKTQTKRAVGGYRPTHTRAQHTLDSFFIQESEYYTEDGELENEHALLISTISTMFRQQMRNFNQGMLLKNIGYTIDDLIFHCISHVDDALSGYPDYTRLNEYVDEFVVLLYEWGNQLQKEHHEPTVSIKAIKKTLARSHSRTPRESTRRTHKRARINTKSPSRSMSTHTSPKSPTQSPLYKRRNTSVRETTFRSRTPTAQI